MTTDPALTRSEPAGEPSFLVKLSYSFGQVAQNGGFDTALGFLFFYYSAVLGLSGTLVGAALAISLAVDAVVDPFIGSWSDALRSRFGRRLPPMVIATPLVALAVGLLFAPPTGLGEMALFAWLLAFSVLARAAVSLFNVPYSALGAEMTSDYRGRTDLVMYRALVGILTAVAITAIGYSLFFADGGLQKAQSYPGFGWSVALIILVCTALCCAGVYRFARTLPAASDSANGMLRRLPGEVREVFSNRSFRTLFISAVILFSATGLNASLNSHAFVFVWKIKSELIQFIGYAYLVGILLGVLATPRLQDLFEKKPLVIVGFGLLIANWLVLQGAMLLGLYLPQGDAALLPMQINSFVAGIGTGMVSVVYPSMMADACDEHQSLYRTRREGLYFAGLGFANKAATGIGVMLAGVALDLARFPNDVGQMVGVQISPEMQSRIVFIWGPGAAVVAVISLFVFSRYTITRARQAEIAAELDARRRNLGAVFDPM